MTDHIYILLPVHNRYELTKTFINCLKLQSYQKYHLVLIDDGSTDGTEMMVSNNIDKLTIIKGSGDWWWAGCLEQGFKFLKKSRISYNDCVLIINDDVTFDKEFFANGLAILNKINRTLLLAQFCDEYSSHPQETGIRVNFRNFSFSQAPTPEEINCLSTRGLFLKWRDFLDIGGFYPLCLPHYFSDYEFTTRAFKKGYRCITSSSVALSPRLYESSRTNLDYSNFISLLKTLFSKKTTKNPIYQISYILLACPLKWIPKNLIKILFSTLLVFCKLPSRKLKKVCASLRIAREVKKYGYDGGYKIIIGAGNTNYPKWISTDIPMLDITDSKSIGEYFKKGSVGVFLSEHVFEHLTYRQAEIALSNCRDYLVPGGHLRIAVPDGFHPDEQYINQVKPGSHVAGAGNHKVLYNYESLKILVEKVGFEANLLEWYDKNGQFHFVDWQPVNGFINRSSRFDQRNCAGKLTYTSLIIDAIKSK